MKKRILHFIGVQVIRAAAIVIMLALTVGSMMYLRGILISHSLTAFR